MLKSFIWAILAIVSIQIAAINLDFKLNANYESYGSLSSFLEIGEFFGETENELFWQWMDIASQFDFSKVTSEEIHEKAKNFVSQDMGKMLDLVVGLRTYSPTVEYWKQNRAQFPCEESDFTLIIDSDLYCGYKNIKYILDAFKVSHTIKSYAFEEGNGIHLDETPDILAFDHIRTPEKVRDFTEVHMKSSAPTILFFGQPGYKHFDSIHKSLSGLVSDGLIVYILRSFPMISGSVESLPGYGVYLDVKRQDYIVIDDNVSNDVEKSINEGDCDSDSFVDGLDFEHLVSEFADFDKEFDYTRGKLENPSDDENNDDDEEKFAGFGTKLVDRIMLSKDPLKFAKDLVTNFPLFIEAINSRKSNGNLEQRMMEVSQMFRPGQNIVTVNNQMTEFGKYFSFNIFEFCRQLTHQLAQLELIADVFPADFANVAEVRESLTSALGESNVDDIRIDVRSNSKGGIIMLNNIEKDKRYKSWSANMDQMFMIRSLHQLPNIRRNFLTLLLAGSPMDKQLMELFKNIKQQIKDGQPWRLGFVPVSDSIIEAKKTNSFGHLNRFTKTENEIANEIANDMDAILLFHQLRLNYKTKASFQFLESVSNLPTPITVELLIETYISTSFEANNFTQANYRSEAVEALTNPSLRLLELFDKPAVFASSKGITQGSAVLNGKLIPAAGMNNHFYQTLHGEIILMQQLVQGGVLDSKTNILKAFTTPGDIEGIIVVERFDGDVFGAVSVGQPIIVPPNEVMNEIALENCEDLLECPIIMIAGDYGKMETVRNLHKYVDRMRDEENPLRIALVPKHQSSQTTPLADVFFRFWQKNVEEDKRDAETMEFLLREWTGMMEEALFYGKYPMRGEFANVIAETILNEVTKEVINSAFSPLGDDKDATNTKVASSLSSTLFTGLGFENCGPEIPVAIVDGIPICSDVLLIEGNIELMTQMFKGLVNPSVVDNILSRTASWSERLLLKSVIHTLRRGSSHALAPMFPPEMSYTKNEHSSMSITAVVDTLSSEGQYILSFLDYLSENINVEINVLFNPNTNNRPLHSFFRLALPDILNGDHVSFNHFSKHELYSVKIGGPESWLMQLTKTDRDLDNLKFAGSCENRHITVPVEYDLIHTLLTGSCHDEDGNAVAALQLGLFETNNNMPNAETLVMENLGYFQLQSQPGVYSLRLASGRHANLYEILAKTDSNGGFGVHLRHFTDESLPLIVKRKEGTEGMELLEDSKGNEEKGFWSRWFGKEDSKENIVDHENSKEEYPGIHVFSIASGSLYERFLKIMMRSVFSQTIEPVTFWLIDNFFTPKFRADAVALGEHYGFNVRFVTYKWPSWLHQQSEKQRIIWGYKILFLDVLFPLSLRRVVYVDADQVVRADMNELMNLDLEGAPYGFTPFCADRNVGYQFWREGYWKNHLRDKPYHISALYVVDLDRFRQLKAGDQLRSYYHQLSQDENSLSNLDQDLPNYAQHMLPIFSLPQEWLWCESWCSDSSKSKAKTIDLCNNPQHKEPKLDMARRIVESWEDWDSEIASILAEPEEQIPSKIRDEL